jgi:hypothetical protein
LLRGDRDLIQDTEEEIATFEAAPMVQRKDRRVACDLS